MQKINDDFIFLDNIDNKTLHFKNKIDLVKVMSKKRIFKNQICIDFDLFLNDILKSFKDQNDIYRQFNCDVVRSYIFLNNKRISNKYEIFKHLEKYYPQKTIDQVIMLTTQALLGIPFQIIINNLILKNFFLSELEDYSKEPYKINIITINNIIKLTANKNFRIFCFENDYCNNLYKVYISLKIILKKNSQVLLDIIVKHY